MSETIIAVIVISIVDVICVIVLAGLLGNVIKRSVIDALWEMKNSKDYEQVENSYDNETKEYVDKVENNNR
jgi:hypothetical protein